MSQFTVGQHTYTCGKMSALTQFHVVRRMAPALVGLAPVITGGATNLEALLGALKVDPLRVVKPLVDSLGTMDDAVINYVITSCLAVVQRQQPGIGWASVTDPNGTLMFEELGMVEIMHLVWKVLEHNVGGFYSALQGLLPSGSEGQP